MSIFYAVKLSTMTSLKSSFVRYSPAGWRCLSSWFMMEYPTSTLSATKSSVPYHSGFSSSDEFHVIVFPSGTDFGVPTSVPFDTGTRNMLPSISLS